MSIDGVGETTREGDLPPIRLNWPLDDLDLMNESDDMRRVRDRIWGKTNFRPPKSASLKATVQDLVDERQLRSTFEQCVRDMTSETIRSHKWILWDRISERVDLISKHDDVVKAYLDEAKQSVFSAVYAWARFNTLQLGVAPGGTLIFDLQHQLREQQQELEEAIVQDSDLPDDQILRDLRIRQQSISAIKLNIKRYTKIQYNKRSRIKIGKAFFALHLFDVWFNITLTKPTKDGCGGAFIEFLELCHELAFGQQMGSWERTVRQLLTEPEGDLPIVVLISDTKSTTKRISGNSKKIDHPYPDLAWGAASKIQKVEMQLAGVKLLDTLHRIQFWEAAKQRLSPDCRVVASTFRVEIYDALNVRLGEIVCSKPSEKLKEECSFSIFIAENVETMKTPLSELSITWLERWLDRVGKATNHI